MARIPLLIVQPWFGAFGHPAQSLLSLAAALGASEGIEYLVSQNEGSEVFVNAYALLQQLGVVHTFAVNTLAGEENTTRAVLALTQLRLAGRQYGNVFFFDATLPYLAKHWRWARRVCMNQRLGVLHMFGPELIQRSPKALERATRLIGYPEVTLYLRTEELADSWRRAFELRATRARIEALPSLEIPDTPEMAMVNPEEISSGQRARKSATGQAQVAFGIIGQIRPGKGIEWLVPIFQRHPELGELTVAGEFNAPETRERMIELRDFSGFVNRFMSEQDMLDLSRAQDYLLMLYDPWDRRMESAVLYVAARVARPVLVYGDSWSGRMVREFDCGVIVPMERAAAIDTIAALPKPGSPGYRRLQDGMARFRGAHSTSALLPRIRSSLFV